MPADRLTFGLIFDDFGVRIFVGDLSLFLLLVGDYNDFVGDFDFSDGFFTGDNFSGLVMSLGNDFV